MGEYADFTLEQIEDFYSLRENWRMGRMSSQEAYNEGIIDELGYEINPNISSKACRCCKQNGLHWRNLNGRWRLFDEKGIHNCPKVPLK